MGYYNDTETCYKICRGGIKDFRENKIKNENRGLKINKLIERAKDVFYNMKSRNPNSPDMSILAKIRSFVRDDPQLMFANDDENLIVFPKIKVI